MSRLTDAPAGVASRRVAWIALAVLAAWSLLLVSLWRPSGGLTGHYAILRPNGDVVPFHQRIDRRINFPVPQRIESAYLFHWDSGRFGGYPTDKPAFDIRWEGLLRVPVDGAYGFAADVQGEFVMTLDDRPLILQPENLTQRSLRAGLHRLTLHYRLTDGEARLVLKWKPPGGKLEIVPSANLAVDREAPGRAAGRRAAAWGVLLLGAGAIVGLMMAARREAGAARLFDLLWSERARTGRDWRCAGLDGAGLVLEPALR